MRSLTVAPPTIHAFRPKYSWRSARVRVTDRHCRHLRRKIKFATKNHKLAKTSGKKKKSPELPATESYNCRACLSHLPWLYNSPINNSIIDQKTVADQVNLNLMKVI